MKAKFLTLLAVPFLLAGCNGNAAPKSDADPSKDAVDGKTYTERAIDLGSKESVSGLIDTLKTCAKNTLLALDNVNVDEILEVNGLDLRVDASTKDGDNAAVVTTTSVNVDNFVLESKEGLAGAISAQKVSDLNAYLKLEQFHGEARATQGNEALASINIEKDLKAAAYLKDANLYLDASELDFDTVYSVMDGVSVLTSDMKLQVKSAIEQFTELGKQFFIPMSYLGSSDDNFSPLPITSDLVDSLLAAVTYEAIFEGDNAEQIKTIIESLKDIYDLRAGEDANHGLILSVGFDFAKAKNAIIDSAYNSFVEAMKAAGEEDVMSKEEFVEDNFGPIENIKDLKIDASIKFNKGFVLSGLDFTVNADVKDLVTNTNSDSYYDEASEKMIDKVSETKVNLKGNIHASVAFDFTTKVSTNMPANFDGYIDLSKLLPQQNGGEISTGEEE